MSEQSGVSIAVGDPFADPPDQRDPGRRLRGRLVAPVTVWTAGSGRTRSGLTVSSVLVAAGDPTHVLGLVSPDADLTDALTETGRFVLHVLGWADRALADVLAGVRPAPGGPFRDRAVEDTEHGPVLSDIATRALCSVVEVRPVGYSVLVDATVDEVIAGDLADPLLYQRGRYRTLGG